MSALEVRRENRERRLRQRIDRLAEERDHYATAYRTLRDRVPLREPERESVPDVAACPYHGLTCDGPCVDLIALDQYANCDA